MQEGITRIDPERQTVNQKIFFTVIECKDIRLATTMPIPIYHLHGSSILNFVVGLRQDNSQEELIRPLHICETNIELTTKRLVTIVKTGHFFAPGIYLMPCIRIGKSDILPPYFVTVVAVIVKCRSIDRETVIPPVTSCRIPLMRIE
ncbi:hypothetical protein SDC9_156068 [bioreactor metagenome]|uniref:Uncharacterized protein n=1 Tax=bioreactor metagenome TaxID=1076179 RepID=A0A645F8I1_9ZZZZ